MELDDTRNRIYIHNIDDELSDMESEEEKLVFLPDIEKRLTRIPRSILTGRQSPPPNSEIVLYNVPESLSIPKEQDKVRKAIIETRERARDRQSLGLHCTNQATTNGQEGSSAGADSHFDVPAANGFEQQDAMDIG